MNLPGTARAVAPAARGPRIVLAWEHGQHLGHLVRLAQVAADLASHGARPAWVLPAERLAHPLLAALAGPRLPAPRVALPGDPARPAARLLCFADVLLVHGFAHAPSLALAVSAWLRVFAALGADAVVCDAAPTALLASRLAGLPTTQITNGFDAPPADCPVFDPKLRGAWVERAHARSLAQLNDSLGAVGQRFGRPALDLTGLMQGAARLCDGVAHTDPYGPRSAMAYVGPYMGSPGFPAPAWAAPHAAQRRVFAYLRGSAAQVEPLLRALTAHGAHTLCVWPDAPEGLLHRAGPLQRSPGTGSLQLCRHPVDLAAALAGADAVVNYGSSSVVASALLAGKPQLMLPSDTEKRLVGARIAALGAGVLGTSAQADGCVAAVAALLEDRRLARAAQAIARLHPPESLQAARQAAAARVVLEAARHTDAGRLAPGQGAHAQAGPRPGSRQLVTFRGYPENR